MVERAAQCSLERGVNRPAGQVWVGCPSIH